LSLVPCIFVDTRLEKSISWYCQTLIFWNNTNLSFICCHILLVCLFLFSYLVITKFKFTIQNLAYLFFFSSLLSMLTYVPQCKREVWYSTSINVKPPPIDWHKSFDDEQFSKKNTIVKKQLLQMWNHIIFCDLQIATSSFSVCIVLTLMTERYFLTSITIIWFCLILLSRVSVSRLLSLIYNITGGGLNLCIMYITTVQEFGRPKTNLKIITFI